MTNQIEGIVTNTLIVVLVRKIITKLLYDVNSCALERNGENFLNLTLFDLERDAAVLIPQVLVSFLGYYVLKLL